MTNKNVNNREGYWYSQQEPQLPKPVAQAWPGKMLWLQKLIRAEKKAESVAYKGMSTCRMCNQDNGHTEYAYKGWQWPSGYLHYIQEHNVRPSLAFEEFIAREGAVSL